MYTCDTGFQISGNSTQICELTSEGPFWSNNMPNCTGMITVIPCIYYKLSKVKLILQTTKLTLKSNVSFSWQVSRLAKTMFH